MKAKVSKPVLIEKVAAMAMELGGKHLPIAGPREDAMTELTHH